MANTKSRARLDTRKLTVLGLLAALIVVLQIISNFIRFGPISITLALAPIIIGGALYGVRAGGVLGFIFGSICLISGLLGWDGGFIMALMSYAGEITFLYVLLTVLLCVGKGVLAGLASATVYRLLEKRGTVLSVVAAGIAAPVVNTGVFALGAYTIFRDMLVSPDYSSAIAVLLLGWIGVNFLVELGTNLVLSTVVTRVVQVGGRMGARKR